MILYFRNDLPVSDRNGIADKPLVRIGGFIVVFQQLPETEVFLYERFVGLFQLEIILDIIVPFVDAAGDLGADIEKGGLVEFVVTGRERTAR